MRDLFRAVYDSKQISSFQVMHKSKMVSIKEEIRVVYERHMHMGLSNGPFIATFFPSLYGLNMYYLHKVHALCGEDCFSVRYVASHVSTNSWSLYCASFRDHHLFAHEKETSTEV